MRRVTVLVALALLGVVANARADLSKPTSPEALQHLQEGIKLYDLAEFEKAIAEFKAGAEIEDRPIFLYNLGQAHRKLGRYKEAIWYYERFLARGNVRPEVERYVRDFIDTMKAEMAQAAREKEPSGPEPSKTAPPVETPPPTIEQPAPPHWYQDKLGWTISGAGFVVALAGGGFLLSASNLDDQADREPDADEKAHLRDKASGRRTVASVLGITGGLALATGIVFLAVTPRSPGKKSAKTTGIAVNFGANWIGIRGRF